MCGIFFAKTGLDINELLEYFYKIKHRGPENSKLIQINNVKMGFHRLAINDLSMAGLQPFVENDDDVFLICNGEIFNYEKLKEEYIENNPQLNEFNFRSKNKNVKMTSESDCEIIIKLYIKFGRGEYAIRKIVKLLDGEYAFVLYDRKRNEIFVARDEFGVRPLFYNINKKEVFFASEVKGIPIKNSNSILPFLPGHYMKIYSLPFDEKIKIKYNSYYNLPLYTFKHTYYKTIYKNISELLEESVYKKLKTVDANIKIGTLLSGGVDSSLICGLLIKKYPDLQCFTVGFSENSSDIIAAKKVAEYIGVKKGNHHCIYLNPDEAFNYIKKVIYHLETWDITTIRAGVINYLAGKYIKENTNVKVIFSGEFADEIFAGYQYSKLAPNEIELYYDTKNLIEKIFMYDGLRIDRAISAHGLEVRIPFADKNLINYVFSLNPIYKKCSQYKMEKLLLRNSFKNSNIIPADILFRSKNAMSDAVSDRDFCWFQFIQNKLENIITNDELQKCFMYFPYNTPMTKEALFYRYLFRNQFFNDNIIEKYWMPKWTNTNDPSATLLNCFQE